MRCLETPTPASDTDVLDFYSITADLLPLDDWSLTSLLMQSAVDCQATSVALLVKLLPYCLFRSLHSCIHQTALSALTLWPWMTQHICCKYFLPSLIWSELSSAQSDLWTKSRWMKQDFYLSVFLLLQPLWWNPPPGMECAKMLACPGEIWFDTEWLPGSRLYFLKVCSK